MKLLNVRLDAEDARRAEALKRAGVPLSRIVREAIRAEHERRLGASVRGRRASEIMAEIYAAFPDPAGLPARSLDTRNRSQVRRAIVGKLRDRRAGK
jgi:hypothetical protein